MCPVVFLTCTCSALLAQPAEILNGRVTDPSGAVVPKATIQVGQQPNGPSRTAKTGANGEYQFQGIQPGRYTITVTAPGFTPYTASDVSITPGAAFTLDVHLSIASQAQQVRVQAQASQLELSPQANASAVVISGKSLDTLSNDPDEFQNQLTALAGPSVGPDGGEIYIDGFIGGDLPPKSAIREIRVNSNPFSVQNDRLGYGRIDISHQARRDRYHGNASMEYNDSSMNALSPFLNVNSEAARRTTPGSPTRGFGGPLGKNVSFYLQLAAPQYQPRQSGEHRRARFELEHRALCGFGCESRVR